MVSFLHITVQAWQYALKIIPPTDLTTHIHKIHIPNVRIECMSEEVRNKIKKK